MSKSIVLVFLHNCVFFSEALNIDCVQPSSTDFIPLEQTKEDCFYHHHSTKSEPLVGHTCQGWSTICSDTPSFDPDSLEIPPPVNFLYFKNSDESMRRSPEIPERFIKSCYGHDCRLNQHKEVEVQEPEIKFQSANARRGRFRNSDWSRERLSSDLEIVRSDKIAGGDSKPGILRRDSYKEAVGNSVYVSFEDRHEISRPRSLNFQAAVEDGQLSPSSVSSQSSSPSVEEKDKTPGIESSGSLNYALQPKYSSTPLINSVTSESGLKRKKSKGISSNDAGQSGESCVKDAGIERELFKQDGLHLNK